MREPTAPHPPPGVRMAYCPLCDGVHPDCPTLTVAGVAWATNYAVSTIYSYLSRKLMPEPIRRSKGSAPRWTPCEIYRWQRNGGATTTTETGEGRTT